MATKFQPGDLVRLKPRFVEADYWPGYVGREFTVAKVGLTDVRTICGVLFPQDVIEHVPVDMEIVITLPPPPTPIPLDSVLEAPELCPTLVYSEQSIATYVEQVNEALQQGNAKVERVLRQAQAKTPQAPAPATVDIEAVKKEAYNSAVFDVVRMFERKARTRSAALAGELRKS